MGGIVKAIKKVVDTVVDAVKDVVDFVVDTVTEVVKFAANVVKGVFESVIGMVEGIVTGDWTKFRDSFFNAFQTVIYSFGAVVGIATGNYWLVTASVIALDGLHNEGKLTTHIVTTIGKIERELFNSEMILENLEIIVSAVIITGSLYSGFKSFPLLADASGLSSFLNSQIVQVSTGIYSMADAAMQFQEAQGLYDELMAQYQAWLQEMNQKTIFFNKLWDEVYGDVDILYEASAGGVLFNSGAGSSEYSVSSIHEQGTYLLGIDSKRDVAFDKYFHDPADIDHTGLNIEDIKPNVLKYED